VKIINISRVSIRLFFSGWNWIALHVAGLTFKQLLCDKLNENKGAWINVKKVSTLYILRHKQ